ncbi:MAG: hypothetical protein RIF39_16780 [Cyclobacteriaceae bacterium]
MHKTRFVIQSVSDESRISSIKKEIAAVAALLRNDVQVFCASRAFRIDSSLTLRMARTAIPNSDQGMGDRHTRLSVALAMTALIKIRLQQENK